MTLSSDSDFQEHVVRLSDPSEADARDAFARLPRQGCLEAVCAWERRLELLAALEEVGAFAICLEPLAGFASVRIVALKGKSGPCYDTGRRAAYRGEAAAVLDDDRHLIVGTIRVCEKTGGIYTLWPYRGVLSVTEADPALLARLDCEPVPFDCNTFDADCQRLSEMLENAQRPTLNAQLTTAIYPGPFRALVLKDGAVVRRGVAALVTEEEVQENGLLRLPLAQAREAKPCETYAAACRERGSAFILEPLGSGATRVVADNRVASELTGVALAALRAAPRAFKRRLLQLIDSREPYLVLTGSDPAEAGGCCPSTQVGVANRLVKAGALQAYAPPAPPDACSVTFYAFRGEIGGRRPEVGERRSELEGERPREPRFRICEEVRQQAAAALRDDRRDGAKRAARFGLLILLGVSLGLSAWRTLSLVQGDPHPRLCAACEAASGTVRWMAGHGPMNAAGAVILGALAAVQPCALALLAGALAVAWRPGVGRWASVARGCALAAGAGLANAGLAAAAAWGVAHVTGVAEGVSAGVRAFRGPLLILAGALLTGLFAVVVPRVSAVRQDSGLVGFFLVGATLGAAWCPVGAGLFAGALLPTSLLRGTPVRDALLYGVGYALPMTVLCVALAAGCRIEGVRKAGGILSAAVGWSLVIAGAVIAWI